MAEPDIPLSGASVDRARRALATGRDLPDDLRGLIRHSWQRSRMSAVPLDRMDVPFAPREGASERLLCAARPVLERFANQLEGTQVSVVLADREACVVGRWAGDRSPLRRLGAVSIEEGFVLAEESAGTNGIGTALEERSSVLVYGPEHYTEPLTDFVCAGVPIRHPISRQIEGVLDLACHISDANRLLLPTAMDLAAQIEQELVSRASQRDRAVFEEFLARSRETSAPLVALGEQFMLTNAASANLLEPGDQPLLWEQASESFGEAVSVVRRIQLSTGGELQAHCTPVRLGALPVGALIEMLVKRGPLQEAEACELARGTRRHGLQRDLETQLRSPAVRDAHRLRIVGENASGKLTVATRIHRARNGNEPCTVIPASLLPVQGVQVWIGSVLERLADPRGTVVIKNLDLLGEDAGRTLADSIESLCGPVPLLIATQTAVAGDGHTPFLDRFGGLVLRVPPLRERTVELPRVIRDLLRTSASPDRRIGNRAMVSLCSYSWPGNLRQLSSVLAEATLSAGAGDIELEHLPDEIAGANYGRNRKLSRLETREREAIVEALEEHQGNKVRAAESLGMSRSTLYRKLRLFGLDTDRALL
jgi:transcriptional regulator of acetoin/glycerol metabolism